jgi:putative ABC transport system substrate-binding protein
VEQISRSLSLRRVPHRPHSQGETPAVLPLQAPSRHDLVLNLKAAMAMGLDVPLNMLSLAHEVIE